MGRLRVDAGGGFPAIKYTLKKALASGGLFRFFSRMRLKNACKTCALGMGGQKGGMVNEAGHFPEFCKKSVQAQAGDMDRAIEESLFKTTSIEDFSKMTPRELEELGRLTFPVIAGEGDTHYRPITWEEAMDKTGDAFKKAPPERTFFYASGRASNEAAFLYQLVARAFGTANIHNCSYYCHQASGVALSKVYGSGTASVVLEDLEKADLAIVVGANPASNHPRLIPQLVKLRNRGGRVIVINPLRELGLTRFRIPSRLPSLLFGSQVSDLYVQPRVGTDVALFKAILKGLLEKRHVDEDYLSMHTDGWEAVRADIKKADWEALLQTCGVSREQVDEIVEILCKSRHGIFLWAMGLTHHTNGVDNILALANIALSQGWLGKPGCGMLPIRGHSNVQGVGTVGVTPMLKEAFASRMLGEFDVKVPKEAGQDTFASMKAAEAGDIDAAFYLGGNLYGSNPDLTWAARAMQTIPFSVYVTTKLNEGHFHGRGKTTIILPALARDEEDQYTTQESMFNYVRFSEGGPRLVPGQMRSEVAMIADFARRVLPDRGIDWQALSSHQKLREAIGSVVPGMSASEVIDKTRQEFQITGRTFHQPHFNTPDGKASFHVTPSPVWDLKDDEFRLMTLRSEGQFNTVVYEEEDLYRGNLRRDVVMMAESDARRLGLNEHDPVKVTSEVGEMTLLTSIVDIVPGCLAVYFPEGNVLVPQHIDPQSKTPAFKSVTVRLSPIKE